MTTKRFTTKQEVLNQLNELYEQDLAIKKDIKCELLCLKEKYEELLEENKQLQHDATILIQSNQDYRKKNEELKKQLMDCEKFRHTVYKEISKEMSKHD